MFWKYSGDALNHYALSQVSDFSSGPCWRLRGLRNTRESYRGISRGWNEGLDVRFKQRRQAPRSFHWMLMIVTFVANSGWLAMIPPDTDKQEVRIDSKVRFNVSL